MQDLSDDMSVVSSEYNTGMLRLSVSKDFCTYVLSDLSVQMFVSSAEGRTRIKLLPVNGEDLTSNFDGHLQFLESKTKIRTKAGFTNTNI